MRISYFLLFLFLLSAFPNSTHAQTIGLEIQPELTTIYTKPGNTFKIPLVVKNTGNQGSFTIKGVTLIPHGVTGDLIPSEERTSGISITPQLVGPFFLPTGAKKNIEMEITIDPQVSPRDYYVGINTVSVGKKRSEGKSSIAIEMNTISTVLLTVTNDGIMNISGYINSFSAGSGSNVRFFDSTQAIPLNLRMHNSGDNWMYTSGTITITNMFGKKQLIQIPQQRVLAGSKRVLRSSQIGIPSNTAILTGMHFGKYTATARMTIEGKTSMATKTITFIAFPIRLLGALVLLGITALIAGIRLNRPAQPRTAHPQRV